MGGVQSLASSDTAIAATAALVVAGTVGYGVMSQQQNGRKDESPSLGTGTGRRGKKKKKLHGGVELDASRSAGEGGAATTVTTTEQAETVTPVVPFPAVIPGDFDAASAATSISSKGQAKDKGKGKAKQAIGDDGASSATPSESQLPTVLASGSKSKKVKKKKKAAGAASTSNLASSLVDSSSKLSTDIGQSPSAAPDEEEKVPLRSSATGIGLESQAAKSKDSPKSAGSSSTEDEEVKKKLSPGISMIGVRTATDVAPMPVIVQPPQGYVSSHDTDSSWTHIRRSGSNILCKSSHFTQPSTSGISTTDITTSDAGIGSSVTDDGYPSSPVAERPEDTEDEEAQKEGSNLASDYPHDTTKAQRRPLAERLLPKPRKTGVEDMLEAPDHPSIARVVRVRPLPGEKPVSGFTWADYEDVHVDEGAGHDADGEDDGWGVVRSRRSKSDRLPASSDASITAPKSQEKVSSGAMTKKQRQNAKKREAAKAARADGEAQRLSALAKHKQQLEKDKMMEQISTNVGRAPSGGMKASVDSNGKLVWD